MTPKEKAEQMFELYEPFIRNQYESASWQTEKEAIKQLALICVDEILNITNSYSVTPATLIDGYSLPEFWSEVKKEIEKL